MWRAAPYRIFTLAHSSLTTFTNPPGFFPSVFVVASTREAHAVETLRKDLTWDSMMH